MGYCYAKSLLTAFLRYVTVVMFLFATAFLWHFTATYVLYLYIFVA